MDRLYSIGFINRFNCYRHDANSKDDINDAFNGSKSELFKNQKTRGVELLLQRVTIVLGVLFVASVITSVALH